MRCIASRHKIYLILESDPRHLTAVLRVVIFLAEKGMSPIMRRLVTDDLAVFSSASLPQGRT